MKLELFIVAGLLFMGFFTAIVGGYVAATEGRKRSWPQLLVAGLIAFVLAGYLT